MHTPAPVDDDCFAIRRAARHISRFYERYLSGAGVTPAQFGILHALSTGEELSMAERACATSTDRTTLVRTLRPLLRGAWVARRVTAERGRGLRFGLTGPGRAKPADAVTCRRDAQRAFERRFGARRAARLRHALSTVVRDVARA